MIGRLSERGIEAVAQGRLGQVGAEPVLARCPCAQKGFKCRSSVVNEDLAGSFSQNPSFVFRKSSLISGAAE